MNNVAKKSAIWAAYAAAIWAFAFAAMSFYWAAGGTVGVHTLGEGIAQMAETRDPELIGLTWITGGLKVLAGVFALLLPADRLLPRPLLRIGAWGAGILLTLYGIGNLIQHSLMATGSSPIAGLLGTPEAVRWHMLLWDPFWILGGILFLVAAWQYSRR